jgi:hypothetical protein
MPIDLCFEQLKKLQPLFSLQNVRLPHKDNSICSTVDKSRFVENKNYTGEFKRNPSVVFLFIGGGGCCYSATTRNAGR